MWSKLLTGISLLSVFYAPLVLANQPKFLVGPVYLDRPGKVGIVVEFPLDETPGRYDFQLMVGDKTVATTREIVPFKDSKQGLDIVLCVDVSGTMKGRPFRETRGALRNFITMTKGRPMDRIALISFADKVTVESAFDDTRERLDNAVDGLKIHGKRTVLYQALYDSFDMFKDDELPKRQRVIVISDGKDENSTKSSDNVIKRSTDRHPPIPIDAVGRGKIEKQYMKSLTEIAKSTFGSFVHAEPDRISLTNSLKRIYNDMLETRSVVVYFEYEMDDSKPTTRNALINLQPTGGTPTTVRIPEEIPTPKFPRPVWLYILMPGLLVICIGLFIWIRHIFKEDEKEPGAIDPSEKRFLESPVDKPQDAELPPSDTITPKLYPKGTMVGSYFPEDIESIRPAFRLVAISGPAEGQQVDVAGDIFNIGSDPENDLDLAVDDYVSGQHASIHCDGGDYLIFDKGSRNRTFVNQIEVTDSGIALSIGDHITIGRSVFEVVDLSS